jgi:hypothetical protein
MTKNSNANRIHRITTHGQGNKMTIKGSDEALDLIVYSLLEGQDIKRVTIEYPDGTTETITPESQKFKN